MAAWEDITFIARASTGFRERVRDYAGCSAVRFGGNLGESLEVFACADRVLLPTFEMFAPLCQIARSINFCPVESRTPKYIFHCLITNSVHVHGLRRKATPCCSIAIVGSVGPSTLPMGDLC